MKREEKKEQLRSSRTGMPTQGSLLCPAGHTAGAGLYTSFLKINDSHLGAIMDGLRPPHLRTFGNVWRYF